MGVEKARVLSGIIVGGVAAIAVVGLIGVVRLAVARNPEKMDEIHTQHTVAVSVLGAGAVLVMVAYGFFG